MAEMPKRYRLSGLWRSLVARLTGGQEVVGSNPASPTKENPRRNGGFLIPGVELVVPAGAYRAPINPKSERTTVRRLPAAFPEAPTSRYPSSPVSTSGPTAPARLWDAPRPGVGRSRERDAAP